MNKYLLDTNVVIELWKYYPSVIDKLIKNERIIILKEVSKELVVKERKEYKGQQLLSERFCKLFLYVIDVDKNRLKEFYSTLNIKHSKKGNLYLNNINKLSENDLLLLYTCHLDSTLILVTEDKYLFNAAYEILGKNRVITLKILIEGDLDKYF